MLETLDDIVIYEIYKMIYQKYSFTNECEWMLEPNKT